MIYIPATCEHHNNKMSYITVFYEFKTLFRSIEKITRKCVPLRNAIGWTKPA